MTTTIARTYRARRAHLLDRIDCKLGIWRWQSDGTPILYRPRTKRQRELSAVYYALAEEQATEGLEF